jgi:hypothetical protein
VAADGLLHTVDTDRGLTLSVFAAPAGTTALAWSGDGRRLLLLAPSELQLRNRGGRVLWRARAPGSTRFGAAALGPGGTVAATLDTRGGSSSQLLRYDSAGHARRLFAGLGRLGEVAYSPSGRWLLVAWRSADQFLFLSPGRPRRIVAISDIAAQFNPGTTAPSAFPRIAGWCCPPGPTAR